MREIFKNGMITAPDAIFGIPYDITIELTKDPERVSIIVDLFENDGIESFNYEYDAENLTISFIPNIIGEIAVDVSAIDAKCTYGSNFYIKIVPDENKLVETSNSIVEEITIDE